MRKDEKDPRAGANQQPMAEEPSHSATEITGGGSQSETLASGSPDGAERTVEGLLRIVGWLDGNDRDLTEEEAEKIFDAAEAEPTSEEQLARLRGGVLRRRFGTTPAADQNSAPASAEVQLPAPDRQPVVAGGRALRSPGSGAMEDSSPGDQRPAAAPSSVGTQATGGVQPAIGDARARPSLLRHCSTLKRKLGHVARELHLDQQTLFELDRGAARSVPGALVNAAATTLGLDREEVARCFAPGGREVVRMAAHGRRGAPASKPAPLRDFLEVIDSSGLPVEEKRYWHDVVAAERAAATGPSENA